MPFYQVMVDTAEAMAVVDMDTPNKCRSVLFYLLIQ